MKNNLRIVIFIAASIIFYILWSNGGESAYGKFVAKGVDKVTAKFSGIERAEFKIQEQDSTPMIYCYYKDRRTKIALEYCLPVVLLLAWHLSLFFDKRINYKIALKLFSINFFAVYLLQIFFPLLLFNISQSKVKSMGLFIGLQIFGFLIFFLIIKDTLLIKYKYQLATKTKN
ncbi:MAG: hypothetical protein KA807_10000 [Prolixibacteraceae bacterium]|nr:hypothetical protein [Prolixibacteraceae bacterium]